MLNAALWPNCVRNVMKTFAVHAHGGIPAPSVADGWKGQCDYAASSIARIAVSGWLIGSTPTRLTIEVMVPSASASTQAARCSRPRWGRPGSNTQPEAAPAHSGSDGVVSDGGCSISSAAG